ncbi:MAG: protein O-mannosyl-transferase family [Chloroflexia bacterium]
MAAMIATKPRTTPGAADRAAPSVTLGRAALPPRRLGLLPAGLALLLYLITASPTINFLDSGELTTVAWTLGIAHPPGYPLYTLISSAFIHVFPLGSPAWRMNLLSALFAALAVWLFYGLVSETLAGSPAFLQAVARRTTAPRRAEKTLPRSQTRPAANGRTAKRPVPMAVPDTREVAEDPARAWAAVVGGLLASGLLACSVTFWDWATQAKMYSLHFAFVAGLLWLALRTRRALYTDVAKNAPPAGRWPPRAWPPAIRLLHLLALLTGLAVTNHYLSFLLVPGIAVLLVAPIGRAGTAFGRIWRHAGTLLATGLLPLLLYLYLPIRSGMDPLMNWGSPSAWGDFWRHVTVWQFHVYIGQGAANLGSYSADALVFAADQFGLLLGVLLLVPIAAGLVYLWRTDRGLLAATVLTALIDVVYTLNYQIREVVVYYVPFYMIVLFWAGLGVGWGFMWAAERLPALRRLGTLAGPALAAGLLVPLAAGVINWRAAGHAGDSTAEMYVHNAFRNFQPNAVVLTNSWDLVSGAYYLQNVLHERPDLTIIDKELLRYPFYAQYVARNYPALVQKVSAQYAEFQVLDRRWVDNGSATSAADLSRLGVLYPALLNSFVDSNLGSRPVYLVFVQTGAEEQAVLSKHASALIPDGLGYRVASGPNDRATTDPQFDLRGITSAPVPLDEVAYSVVWLYPQALNLIGAYLQAAATTPDQQQTAARLIEQAQTLRPVFERRDSRPRLR